MGSRSVSLATLKVLRAFLDDAGHERYGLDLIQAAGVKGGSLYPILSRLEDEGWVTGTWEEIDERTAGRRRRRYYRLTAVGQRAAINLLDEARSDLLPRPTRWART